MKTNTHLVRSAVACGALLAAIAGSTFATPQLDHTVHVRAGDGQPVDEHVVVRVRMGDQQDSNTRSRTIYEVNDDGDRTKIEVTSEDGHTVVKLNGEVVSEFDNKAWGKFEIKDASGEVIAHVVQVPGGSVVVRPGDAMSAWNAIGGLNIDIENLDVDAMKNLGFPERFRFFARSMPGQAPKVMLGVTMDDLSEEEAKVFGVDGGTLITNIFEGSPAAKAGLQDGDVIVEIDGEVVDSSGLIAVVRGAEPGRTIHVQVLRDGETINMPIELVPFDGEVMEFSFGNDENWPGNNLGEGTFDFEFGDGTVQIDKLKDLYGQLNQSGQLRGTRGVMRLLQNDEMREARKLIAELAQDMEQEALRLTNETGDARAQIEERMVELGKELSMRSAEIARLSAKGAMRNLRFFGPGENGFSFDEHGAGQRLLELVMPDGDRLLAEPPMPPRVGSGQGDDARRYEDMVRRYENERDARQRAEERLDTLNQRLERLEDRLGELLDKLSER